MSVQTARKKLRAPTSVRVGIFHSLFQVFLPRRTGSSFYIGFCGRFASLAHAESDTHGKKGFSSFVSCRETAFRWLSDVPAALVGRLRLKVSRFLTISLELSSGLSRACNVLIYCGNPRRAGGMSNGLLQNPRVRMSNSFTFSY